MDKHWVALVPRLVKFRLIKIKLYWLDMKLFLSQITEVGLQN